MNDFERYGDYQPSDRGRFGLGVTLLLVGLGAGALTALLFAPRSGKQMRKILRRKYEDAVDTINDQRDTWVERGSDWARRGQEIADDVRDRVEPIRKAVRNRG
ncbi:MAG TPA: YtxH domain-containing protein [Terriglobales bacterium]|nr:YtxH domain-containing protein [Terriglobales bacterium]